MLPQIENTSVQPSLVSGERGIAWPATADLFGEASSAKEIMQTVTGSKSSRAEDSCSHSPNPLGCMQVMVRVRAGLPNEYWFLRLLKWLSPMVIHRDTHGSEWYHDDLQYRENPTRMPELQGACLAARDSFSWLCQCGAEMGSARSSNPRWISSTVVSTALSKPDSDQRYKWVEAL